MHSEQVRAAFEAELRRRGVAFAFDAEAVAYRIEADGWQLTVSLDNLERRVALGEADDAVAQFVTAVLSAVRKQEAISAEQLYWSLEAGNQQGAEGIRVPVSDLVDRVLVHVSSNPSLLTWVTATMLEELGLSHSEASDKAFANLAVALAAADIHFADAAGVPLAMIETVLPGKASLLLAPNLREVVGERLGWPLLAVAPDRDFLYLWPAQHRDFITRVGPVVVREFARAPYPLSTEVYEITVSQIRAIGEIKHHA